MTQDVNVIFADMPGTISAYSIANPDFSFTIVINSRLNKERQLEAYHHELQHIQNKDFDLETPVDSIEHYAHIIPSVYKGTHS